MQFSQYDTEMVKPMWMELDGIGVKPLTTADDVDNYLKNTKGTALLFVNSVCGCAAGSARPAIAKALQNELIPDRLATVFAGVDKEATEKARSYMPDIKPSSPSIAMFKDGELVFSMERQKIEVKNDDQIAAILIKAFNEHCSAKGPSVSWETVLKVFKAE